MGRWAEVYFTSAPDKREEAVLELLRELEGRNSEQVHSASQAAPAIQKRVPLAIVDNAASESARGDLRHCPTCDHPNIATHQFCGMCGSLLDGAIPEELRSDEIEETVDPQGGGDRAEASYAESETEFRERIEAQPVSSAGASARNPYDLSLFQGLRENELEENFEDDRSPSVRYRYYIGAVLAILILALGYMAWSGSGANQGAQGTPPPPAPGAAESAATPANQSTESAASNPAKDVEPRKAVPSANSLTVTSTPKPAETLKPALRTADAGHVPTSTPAATSPAPNFGPTQPAAANGWQPSSTGNGSEEFALAQRYLASQPRDSAEAAKWLWKAMAKHNGPSMVALADLYLKGDGVSKNCDQARVLLDSAAQRGMAGAGQRLRNLQAFGCQ
jgi:hypothetical protein